MYENERRILVNLFNSSVENMTETEAREFISKTEKDIYNTKELQESFNVVGFIAPFVSVVRKSDNKKGMMTFTHYPRFYFGFEGEK